MFGFYTDLLPPSAKFLALAASYIGNEKFDVDLENEAADKYIWREQIDSYHPTLSRITNIEESLIEPILSLSSDIRINTEDSSLENQCIHCKNLIDDFYLHNEFDAPFSPVAAGGMELIQKLKIEKRFLAHANGHGNYSSTWDDSHHLIHEVFSFNPDTIPHFESKTTLC